MGKKSRKKKPFKASGATLPNAPAAGTVDGQRQEIVLSTTSADAFAPPTFADGAAPKVGWARELREGEKSLRRNPDSSDAVVRAARAARVMRRFESLEKILAKAEAGGVAIDGADDRALLSRFREEAAAWKARRTRVDEPAVVDLFRRAMNDDMSLDTCTMDHPTYAGLSALQYAACTSDVRLLEKLVALGAALDFEHKSPSPRRAERTAVAKPSGCTALLMAVIMAICARELIHLESSAWRPAYEGAVECAVQLVRLGARVDVTLRLPPGRDGTSHTYAFFRTKNLVGKSIKELAPNVGSWLLVQTIEELGTDEAKLRLVNCRCGSRLPWAQCHAAGVKGAFDRYCARDVPGQINWRVSPLSPCPCKNTSKAYFRCCWEEQSWREYNMDDVTSQICVSMRQKITNAQKAVMAATFDDGDDFSSWMEFLQSKSHEDVTALKLRMIRQGGSAAISMMVAMSRYAHPKNRMSEYDPEVYAGTMENMDDPFDWFDVHWSIPKPELLKRVDEWNEGLDRYCDSIGLHGAERDAVVAKNRASPYAPCANAKCDKVEKKVKQFARCSRCLAVGYCSPACQHEDYKAHKVYCLKR